MAIAAHWQSARPVVVLDWREQLPSGQVTGVVLLLAVLEQHHPSTPCHRALLTFRLIKKPSLPAACARPQKCRPAPAKAEPKPRWRVPRSQLQGFKGQGILGCAGLKAQTSGRKAQLLGFGDVFSHEEFGARNLCSHGGFQKSTGQEIRGIQVGRNL